MNRNDMTYWWPLVVMSQARAPRTIIVQGGIPTAEFIEPLGKDHARAALAYGDLNWMIQAAAKRVGTPCFLRNGHTSAKHHWQDTCYLPDAELETVQRHVYEIAEFSVMADMTGSMNWVCSWAVRELLAVEPIMVAFIGRIPVVREVRAFCIDGEIVCAHPYWPPATIRCPSAEDWQTRLAEINDLAASPNREDLDEQIEKLRSCIGTLGGNWSIDCLYGADGLWYVTDMAIAEDSYHWPTCPNAPADMQRYGDPDVTMTAPDREEDAA